MAHGEPRTASAFAVAARDDPSSPTGPLAALPPPHDSAPSTPPSDSRLHGDSARGFCPGTLPGDSARGTLPGDSAGRLCRDSARGLCRADSAGRASRVWPNREHPRGRLASAGGRQGSARRAASSRDACHGRRSRWGRPRAGCATRIPPEPRRRAAVRRALSRRRSARTCPRRRPRRHCRPRRCCRPASPCR
jgi:hypothetical protein